MNFSRLYRGGFLCTSYITSVELVAISMQASRWERILPLGYPWAYMFFLLLCWASSRGRREEMKETGTPLALTCLATCKCHTCMAFFSTLNPFSACHLFVPCFLDGLQCRERYWVWILSGSSCHFCQVVTLFAKAV